MIVTLPSVSNAGSERMLALSFASMEPILIIVVIIGKRRVGFFTPSAFLAEQQHAGGRRRYWPFFIVSTVSCALISFGIRIYLASPSCRNIFVAFTHTKEIALITAVGINHEEVILGDRILSGIFLVVVFDGGLRCQQRRCTDFIYSL